MHRMGWIVALAMILAFTGCGGVSSGGRGNNSQPPLPDTISGTVSYKGAPLAGATVTDFLTNSNVVYQVAITDAGGGYTFTGMSVTGDVPGEYQVYVNKAGYGFYPSVGPGARVMRADYTGQFQGAGQAPSGLLFSVIDFQARPNSPLTGANFAAYDGTNPRIVLPATGQQISYATGDDGSVKSGAAWSAATRFTDNQDGTVTDSLTGLIWLKDAGCLGTANWSDGLAAAQALASGACGLTDNSAVGQWRMPNLVELESLMDASAANPALPPNAPFLNVSSGIYWSSTSYYGGITGSSEAFTIRMSDGRYINDNSSTIESTSINAVWAVRGAGSGGTIQLPATGFHIPYAPGDDGTLQTGVGLDSPRFLDNQNGTITDTMTGLIWLKQADCIQGQWSDALAAVTQLASGQCGLSDSSAPGQWRMPNRNELESLSDRAQTNMGQYFDYTYLNQDGSVYQAPIFIDYVEQQYYWTSSSYAADPTQAWTVYSCDFGIYNVPKTNIGYTLAVR